MEVTEKQKLKLCQYPKNGFGEKNGNFYLLSQWGEVFDFKNEYDDVLDESYWFIVVNGQTFNGISPSEIVSKMNNDGYNIKRF